MKSHKVVYMQAGIITASTDMTRREAVELCAAYKRGGTRAVVRRNTYEPMVATDRK